VLGEYSLTLNIRYFISRLALKIVVMTREQGTGNREEVLSNFTFRYLCRFFSAHLLTNILTPQFLTLVLI
ncbi:MAG: hypothetical protein ACLBM2_11515, partial [Dolichospermum sp.]